MQDLFKNYKLQMKDYEILNKSKIWSQITTNSFKDIDIEKIKNFFSNNLSDGIDNSRFFDEKIVKENFLKLCKKYDEKKILDYFVDEDFSRFNLYRNDELHVTLLDSQYVDVELPGLPLLTYSVSAVDYNGNESVPSSQASVNPHLMGDINDDFALNVLDVVMLMEHILGNILIEDLTYGDINEDGGVDILDVVILVNIIVNSNGM